MEPTTIEDALARIEERPGDAELFQQLGLLYLKQGRFAESRAAYERSLELAPDDPWTHLYLGNWCYYHDRFNEALRWFRRAAQLLPDQAIVYACLGDIYRRQGRDNLAEEAFRKAYLLDPNADYARRRFLEWRASRYAGRNRPEGEPRAPRPNLVTRGRERRTPHAR